MTDIVWLFATLAYLALLLFVVIWRLLADD